MTDSFKAGVPSLQDLTSDDLRWGWCNNIEIRYTIHVMCLNHPQTIPQPQVVEKLSSMKLVPVLKRLGTAALKRYTWSLEQWKMNSSWRKKRGPHKEEPFEKGTLSCSPPNRPSFSFVSIGPWCWLPPAPPLLPALILWLRFSLGLTAKQNTAI